MTNRTFYLIAGGLLVLIVAFALVIGLLILSSNNKGQSENSDTAKSQNETIEDSKNNETNTINDSESPKQSELAGNEGSLGNGDSSNTTASNIQETSDAYLNVSLLGNNTFELSIANHEDILEGVQLTINLSSNTQEILFTPAPEFNAVLENNVAGQKFSFALGLLGKTSTDLAKNSSGYIKIGTVNATDSAKFEIDSSLSEILLGGEVFKLSKVVQN